MTLLVLSLATTPVEQELVRAWAREQVDEVEVLDAGGPAFADRWTESDDPLVVPVSVVWLPQERGGERSVRWSDFVLLNNPRKPRNRSQRSIVTKHPDRWRVIVGEGARVSDLRTRWQNGATRSQSLSSFVLQQATVTLQRSERALIGDRYKVPRLVAEQIEVSDHFNEAVSDLAQQLGQPREVVRVRAIGEVHKIATVESQLARDLFLAIMSPMHKKAWTIKVDEQRLEALRELNKKQALVFLPSHRSYADPLIVGEVLARYDFPTNHTLGGNNMSFWPLGTLGRRSGIVFIPRSMKGDESQKLALREFLGFLVSKRFNLEWYLEGGRSRTGKLKAPRYGLLRYLVDAVEAGRTEDVQLVPVSITYEQLPEIAGMVEEDSGAKKAPETLAWFVKYIRSHQRALGAVHVSFGEPLSLQEGLGDAAPDQLPLHKVAFEVYDRINSVTPILGSSLATVSLLGVRQRGLSLAEADKVLQPLLRYAAIRQLPQSGLEALGTPAGLAEAFATLEDVGVVTAYDRGTEPVFSITPGKHSLAAYYRNGAVHWFVTRGIVELAILKMAETGGDDPVGIAWDEALRLRDLLKYEFFFSSKRVFNDQVLAELELVNPAWRDHTRDAASARELLVGSGLLTAHRMLRSFLEAYSVVAERLCALQGPLENGPFLDSCIAVGRQQYLQGRLHSEESVSRALFETGLQLAENRGLLTGSHNDRRAFADEIEDVLRRVALISDLDEEVRHA